jgi:hypothetical protein
MGRFVAFAAGPFLSDEAEQPAVNSLRQSGMHLSYFAGEFVTRIPGLQAEAIDLTLADAVIDLSED